MPGVLVVEATGTPGFALVAAGAVDVGPATPDVKGLFERLLAPLKAGGGVAVGLGDAVVLLGLRTLRHD